MSQPSHKAAYTRFSIRITSGDYSRIDFYGLVDKRPDTGDGGLRNSLLSTGIGPGADPRPRIVMTDSSTGERTLLEAPAENVYFHLWAQLKEGAAYQLE
ncbi:MAG: glycoside hydrolase family 32 protein, partial [Parascardovia denticolens]